MSGPFPPDADGPRPLPEGLAERLEGELADVDVIRRLDAADGPRPVPEELAERLEATLVHRHLPLTRRFRRRLERRLVGHRAVPVPLAVAATTLLLLGVLALPFVGGETTGETVDEPATSDDESVAAPRLPDGASPGPGPTRRAGSGGADSGAPTGGRDTGAVTPPPASGPEGDEPAAGSQDGDDDGAAEGPGPAPPFTEPSPSRSSDAFVPNGSNAFQTDSDSRPPLRFGLVVPDVGDDTTGDVEAGFRAYVELLNERGGVRHRRVELMSSSPPLVPGDVVALVNATGGPLRGEDGEPYWDDGPFLEGVAAEERHLEANVLSFASVLERQAHLAALEAFPDPQSPERAVVYRAESGPYGERVASAYEEALESLDVVTVTSVFDPDSPMLVPADAAFLSLPRGQLDEFVAAAEAEGYAPDRGIWGIASLHDEALAGRLGPAYRVGSPYAPSGVAEMAELRERAGRPASAETIHGWVTAKMLAVAVWRTDASTPEQLLAALEELEGFRNGFMPPYEVREGTRSRTPEAVVLRAADGVFERAGEFLRDPF